MIIGISMGHETCQILGQVSHNLLYWMKNLPTDICGPGGTDKTAGQLKNQSSIMLEDYEESISLTLRTRSLKKPLGLLEENWKHQWLQPCLAKYGETRSKTNDFKSKFACILEASGSTRLRMEESLPNYHEDHIAGQGDNSLQQKKVTNLFLCLKP